MIQGSLGLRENGKKEHSETEMHTEGVPLEVFLTERTGSGWRIEAYLDENQTEHIRVCKEPDAFQEEAQLWDVFSFEGEEAPLELWMEIGSEDPE